MAAGSFEYSAEFHRVILKMLEGSKARPQYDVYLRANLGGPTSRLAVCIDQLYPEIEYHCGLLKDKRVLDFGCGTGSSAAALAPHCDKVVCFDVDQECVDISRQRLREHKLEDKAEFYYSEDIDTIKDRMGKFDIILLNAVIEHIPLSEPGLRQHILKSAFDMLNSQGFLYINDTPNRLYPRDGHSTQLWWGPWTKPGSEWTYKRAVRKGRWSDVPGSREGTLGLEIGGAWGVTYWEIMGYLKGENAVCLNTLSMHDRHVYYMRNSWKWRAFDSALYLPAKLLRVPITALANHLMNLVIAKR